MLKKKALTETVYNNGDPFQIREAISACIGAWQKREDVEVLWDTLDISTEYPEDVAYYGDPGGRKVYSVYVEAVYREDS